MHAPFDWNDVKGFLPENEAAALHQAALAMAPLGPMLEIGSYCGKSTLYLAAAAREHNSLVFAVDHHAGSEEHQPGEMFHDPELLDASGQAVDTFTLFRHNLRRAGLETWVVPVVAPSERAARHWHTPLALLFIDGGHSLDAALTDYRCWAGHVLRGGILAIHDVYRNAEDGGQAPRAIEQMARASGLFRFERQVGSLVLLTRT